MFSTIKQILIENIISLLHKVDFLTYPMLLYSSGFSMTTYTKHLNFSEENQYISMLVYGVNVNNYRLSVTISVCVWNLEWGINSVSKLVNTYIISKSNNIIYVYMLLIYFKCFLNK